MPRYPTQRLRAALSRGMSYSEIEAFAGPDDQLGQLIDWKAGGIAVLKYYKLDTISRGAHMQRQLTMELRVDFADQEKLPAIQQAFQQAARHVLATARLISDNPKSTQIAIYSEDFFSGHQEIALLDDVIQQGLDATSNDESQGISSELMGAMGGS